MKNVKTLLAVSALAFGMATSASAITISSDMSVDITPNVNNAFEIVFSWPDQPNDGLSTVPIAFDFDLTVESFSSSNASVGFLVTDANGMDVGGGLASNCADGTPNGTPCNLVFSAASTPITLAEDLSAGIYTFKVFGGSVPNAGSLSFGITKVSEVPLPAGGLLLLTALGGIAATRRRKS